MKGKQKNIGEGRTGCINLHITRSRIPHYLTTVHFHPEFPAPVPFQTLPGNSLLHSLPRPFLPQETPCHTERMGGRWGKGWCHPMCENLYDYCSIFWTISHSSFLHGKTASPSTNLTYGLSWGQMAWGSSISWGQAVEIEQGQNQGEKREALPLGT